MSDRPVGSGIANTPHLMAYVDAFQKTLNTIDLSKILVQLPDLAPVVALPFLAEQFDVNGIKGYQFCNTEAQRRGLIKAAPELKRTAGTPGAIELAIISVGLPNALVTERTGIFYNGIYNYDGSKRYGGQQWYNIDVEVFYTDTQPSNDDATLIRKLIDVYKSERSQLLNLKFSATP